MCGYFCIRFTDFMPKVKGLLDYTNLFSPNECEKDGKLVSLTKSLTSKSKNYIALFIVSIKNLKIIDFQRNVSSFCYLQ